MLTSDTLRAFDLLFTFATLLQAVPFVYDARAAVIKLLPRPGSGRSSGSPSRFFSAFAFLCKAVDIGTFVLVTVVVAHFFFVPKPVEAILIQVTAYGVALCGFGLHTATYSYKDEIVDLVNKLGQVNSRLLERSGRPTPQPVPEKLSGIPVQEIIDFFRPRIPTNGEDFFELFSKSLLGIMLIVPLASFVVLAAPNSPFMYELCSGSCQFLWRLVYSGATATTTFFNAVRIASALCLMMGSTLVLRSWTDVMHELAAAGGQRPRHTISDYNALCVYFAVYRESISEMMPLVSSTAALIVIFSASSLIVFQHAMPLTLKGPLLLVLGITVLCLLFGFRLTEGITANTSDVLDRLRRLPPTTHGHRHRQRQLRALQPVHTRCGSFFIVKRVTPLTILAFLLSNVASAIIAYHDLE